MERVKIVVVIATVLLVALIGGTLVLLRLSDEKSESRVCRWLASIGELKLAPAYFGLIMWLAIILSMVWKDIVAKFGRMPLSLFAATMVFVLVVFVGLGLGFVAYEKFLEKGS